MHIETTAGSLSQEKARWRKKDNISKLSETPNVSPLCLIHVSLRALWNKLLLDFAFQWSSLMHIQFAYGRAENAPAGTLSLSAPPMRTATSCFHFSLMQPTLMHLSGRDSLCFKSLHRDN